MNRKPEYNIKIDIKEVRKTIFERDGKRCFYCGISGENVELHLDHILPKSKYSQHNMYNLITSCKQCNFKKSYNLLPKNILKEVKQYIDRVNLQFHPLFISLCNTVLNEYYSKQKRVKDKNRNPRQRSLNHYLEYINGPKKLNII